MFNFCHRRYSSHCRLILICNSASKVIEPVRSRCLGIRIPSPSCDELNNLLVSVAKKENMNIDITSAMKISLHSERNIRKALLILESSKIQNPVTVNLTVNLPDWEIYINRMAREILQEQSPAKLLQVREMFYELLTNCIPVDVIFQALSRELMKTMDDTLKHELIYLAAYYEHRSCQGNKDIFHLEAFVSKFMTIYKKYLISMFS